MKYSAMSVSSVGSRQSECLLGKHQARLGQGPQSMIDLSESEVKSGAPVETQQPGLGRVTTPLLSPLHAVECW